MEHDVGEIARPDILQSSHLNHHLSTGKNVKGGHGS